ncbi:glycosyltransferase family 4 protein [Nitrolancea hollandica]|uniref:Glycosyltransferase (Modular protein) n=1 Tax=Nitrolancea hollandica Lb TaxID=1129897 RepID=I4EEQ6_9BACT|nr:glycosyltransferase family 4 protein [Nitrolancea hollandica]CCF83168.1 Glycosyltransferase (modular protein) [Nitrolancea hollandica Lb]
MRIAHVTATFPPYYAGTGNVCYHNARVLAARGHDVHVFTADWPGEPDDPPGVTVHRLKPVVRVGNAPVLPQLLRLGNFDLVHLHYPFYSGAEFVALSGTPYVVTYHQDVQLAGWLGRATSFHGRTIGKRLLKRAARLCPTSLDYLHHSAIADLAPSLGDRVVELPNGVDLERFRPGPLDLDTRRRWGFPEDAVIVLLVGGMDRAHYFKGVPTLLQALTQVPDASAILVGDGDLRPRFERQAQALGLSDRVRFTGRVGTDELPRLYRAADVLVLPSQTPGEAFGMVLLEAMASGRLVIATDLPGVRSVVAHGRDGFLVRPGNARELAATIAPVVGMTVEERLALGAAGRAKVEARYDWERIGDRLEAIYAAALGEKALPAIPATAWLPVDLRAALELIAVRGGGLHGSIRARVIGEPRLVTELGGYAPVTDDPNQLIALGTAARDLRAVISAARPERVLTLVEGPLGGLLRPARASSATLPVDLSNETWQGLGYVKVMSRGVQGLGSIGWAAGERLLKRLNRPDLADRCRAAMLRTLATSRIPGSPATIKIHEYRRVA